MASLWIVVLVAGGTSCHPKPMTDVPFMECAVSQENEKIRVTVAVPTAQESAPLFGVPLAVKGIQPVWLRIENHDSVPYGLLPLSLDPDYFAPREVAYLYHSRLSSQTQQEMEVYCEMQQIRFYLPPGAVNTGFIYTNLVEGAKFVNVELWQDNGLLHFGFFVLVPGSIFDYELVDFERLYVGDQIGALERQDLRAVLERLPCCTTNAA